MDLVLICSSEPRSSNLVIPILKTGTVSANGAGPRFVFAFRPVDPNLNSCAQASVRRQNEIAVDPMVGSAIEFPAFVASGFWELTSLTKK
jgi:hypothetical protein